MDKDLLWETES